MHYGRHNFLLLFAVQQAVEQTVETFDKAPQKSEVMFDVEEQADHIVIVAISLGGQT